MTWARCPVGTSKTVGLPPTPTITSPTCCSPAPPPTPGQLLSGSKVGTQVWGSPPHPLPRLLMMVGPTAPAQELSPFPANPQISIPPPLPTRNGEGDPNSQEGRVRSTPRLSTLSLPPPPQQPVGNRSWELGQLKAGGMNVTGPRRSLQMASWAQGWGPPFPTPLFQGGGGTEESATPGELYPGGKGMIEGKRKAGMFSQAPPERQR